MKGPQSQDTVARLSKHYTVSENHCWMWTAAKDRRGYGRTWDQATKREGALAHKVMYEVIRGPVLLGYELDHLCRNPSCINPEHLEPVCHRENCQRGLTGKYPRSDTCKRGHSLKLAPINTNGARRCRKCAAFKVREHRRKKEYK